MAALQKQPVQVIFGALDTKTDPKTQVPGAMDLVENAYRKRANEYRKRNGLTPLSLTQDAPVVLSAITAGRRIGTRGNELINIDDSHAYSWNGASEKMQAKHLCGGASLSIIPRHIFTQISACTPEIAIAGDLALITMWVGTGGGGSTVNYAIVDLTTGQVIPNPPGVPLQLSSRPRVVAIGTDFYVFADRGSNTIRCAKINASNISTTPTWTNIVTDAHSTLIYDVAVDAVLGKPLVAYRKSDGSLKVVRVTTALAVDDTFTDTFDPDNALGFLHHNYVDGKAYLAAASTDGGVGVHCFAITTATMDLSSDTTIDTAATDVRNVTGYRNPTGPATVVLYEVPGASSSKNIIKVGNGSYTATMIRSVGLLSKAFKVGSKFYVCAGYQSSTPQYSMFVLEVVNDTSSTNVAGDVVGAIKLEDGGGNTVDESVLPSVAMLSSTVALVPYDQIDTSVGGTLVHGTGYATLDFSAPATVGGLVESVGSALIPGGVLNHYDGARPIPPLLSYEAGFFVWPEAPTLAESSSGSLENEGTYEYVAVYRFLDNSGRVWRSAVSPVGTITLTGSNHTVTATIQTLRVTGKRYATMVVELYATTDAGQAFYFVGSATNTTTSDTVTVTHSISDTALQANELLYIDGGALDNDMPPCPRIVATHRDRVMVVSGASDIWPSKRLAEGLGVAFSADTRIQLPDEDGYITAAGSLDGTFVLFKRNSIYTIAGEGPDEGGTGQYDTPTRLAGSIGAISAAVARIPDGLVFKSAKGFWLLDRGLNATYIGAQVEAYNDHTVTGCAVVDKLNQVRFTTAQGYTLVYDWFFKSWSVFTGQAAVGCCLWQEQFTILASNGTPSYEDATSFVDDDEPVLQKYRTAHIALAGIAGYKRLYRIQVVGEYKGAHTLRVTLHYNHSSTASEVFEIDPDDLTYDSANNTFRFEVKPKLQKCVAVQIQVEDVSDAETEGFWITGVTLLCGVKPGRLGPRATARVMEPTT